MLPALVDSHRDLHLWFLLHQECLIAGQDKAALDAWNAFRSLLTLHIAFEDGYVLPLAESVSGGTRWSETVYSLEHRKLETMAVSLDSLLQDYPGFHGRHKRLALLTLLGEQQRFHHVLEHHEQREEKDLFRCIDALSPQANRYWQSMEGNWKEQNQPLLKKLDQLLNP